MNYLFKFLSSLAFCFIVHGLSLNLLEGGATKGESNYFSSIARMQAGAAAKAEIALLGSSITGRFPLQGVEGLQIANFGQDGGCAADALDAISSKQLPESPLVLIEGNTLFLARAGASGHLRSAIGSYWFELGQKVPALGARARPVSMLYSEIWEARLRSSQEKISSGNDFQIETRPHVVLPAKLGGGDEEEFETSRYLVELIKGLKNRGVSPVVVMLPPLLEPDDPKFRLAHRVAAESGALFWDVAGGIPDGAVILTDRVHMDPESAKQVLKAMVTVLRAHGLVQEED